MFEAEWMKEFGVLISPYKFSKYELIAFLVFLGVISRIGTILKHYREMAVIKADFAMKNAKLNGKLEAEKAKRAAKLLKGRS